jgi:hypothetical protein
VSRPARLAALELLFNIVRERSEEYAYSVTISVVEIYNESPRDLLVSKREYQENKKG